MGLSVKGYFTETLSSYERRFLPEFPNAMTSSLIMTAHETSIRGQKIGCINSKIRIQAARHMLFIFRL
jgi:hypothetical protein